MQIISTDFEGLIVIKPAIYCDNRGAFYEDWHSLKYTEAGITTKFVQDDFSISTKNVLRGLHGQIGQAKLIQIVSGSVLDVLVDLRPKSKTYKRHFSILLSEDEPTQVFAPDGFVHGFCVLSDKAIMHYKCSTYYNKIQEYGFRWNDSAFKIHWPDKEFILSDKDNNQPIFNDGI